jgi:hypothetical protein
MARPADRARVRTGGGRAARTHADVSSHPEASLLAFADSDVQLDGDSADRLERGAMGDGLRVGLLESWDRRFARETIACSAPHLDLPWQRDPKLDWRQNAGQLRDAMRQGRPIRDADPGDVKGRS